MKLALHRSITFWSGLLVMGFVCWTWQDSTKTATYVLAGKLEIQSEGSGVRCTSCFSYPFMWGAGRQDMGPSLAAGGTPPELSKFRFAQPEFVHFPGDVELLNTWYHTGELRGRKLDSLVWQFLQNPANSYREGDWLCLIPHWLILLGVAVTWLALLLWRAKKRSAAWPETYTA